MDSFVTQQQQRLNKIKCKEALNKIRSIYILKAILRNLKVHKYFDIIKYNKKLQKRLNLSLVDYKEFSKIEIEIVPHKNEYGKFINFKNSEKQYYHIYFNYSEKERKKNYIDENEKIYNIIVKIDREAKSIHSLFRGCYCIKSINFKRFYRSNIFDLSYMFSGCTLLQELNLSNFNTENVKDMSFMFYECSSLDQLNMSNFITNNVTHMSEMFNGCSSLVNLDLSNFNLKKVKYMTNIFNLCISLKNVKFNLLNVGDNINKINNFHFVHIEKD